MESPFSPAVMQAPPNVTPITPDVALPSPEDLDAVIERLHTLLESSAMEQMHPQYPDWYRKEDYPKPDPGKALEECRRLWNDYAPLRQRFDEDIRFINSTTATVFNDASNNERANAAPDISARADYELVVTQLSSIEPTILPEIYFTSDRDEAANKIDFLNASFRDHERRHSMAGGPSLRTDVARIVTTYGHIAAQLMPRLSSARGQFPLCFKLIEPAQLCPVFEGERGICRIARHYRTTVREALAAYDYDGKLRRQVMDGRNRDGTFARKYNDYDEVEIDEYWDRRWRIVWLNGEVILGPVETLTWYPPFIYIVGDLGAPSVTSDIGNPPREVPGRPGEFYSGTRSSGTTRALKGLSHVHLLRHAHQLREAIMNRTLTQFRRSIDPAMVWKRSVLVQDEDIPPVDRSPNAVTPVVKDEEDIEQLPTSSGGDSLGPLMQILGDGLAKASIPLTAYGINTNSNVSGFAVESLAEAGRDKLNPHMNTMGRFWQAVAEMELSMVGDIGYLMKQEGNDRGIFTVPRSNPGETEDPFFHLTYEDIRRTSPNVRVKMTNLSLHMMGPLANAIAIRRNMNLITERQALELFGDPNPERTIQELRLEQARNDPRLIEADLIRYLVQQGDLATAQYIIQRQQQQAQQPPPGSPRPAGPVGIQGASLPAFGQGPGPGTGPQGTLGPRTPQPF